MINIVLQSLICGIASAALSRMVVYYSGPFEIFPRFKLWLLPKLDVDPPVWVIESGQELTDHYTEILMLDQEYTSVLEMWKNYHDQYDYAYHRTSKGTLYGILDCTYCLGIYVCGILALISTIYVMLLDPIGWHHLAQWVLVTVGAYGIHFMISKRWEPND